MNGWENSSQTLDHQKRGGSKIVGLQKNPAFAGFESYQEAS